MNQQRAWRPGDSIESHPLWEEQIQLEMEMVQRGAEKFRARIAAASDPDAKRGRPSSRPPEMTRLKPIQERLEEMVPTITKYLKAWINKCRCNRGARPLALPHLEHMDPGVASYIAARTILDSVGQGHRGVLGVARQIGMEIEYQARMDAWMKEAPDLFYEVQHSLRKQKATPRHVRRVNINRFNALMKEKLDWQEWGQDMRRAVGLRLIDVVVTAIDSFSVVPDPGHGHERYLGPVQHPSRPARNYLKPQYVIAVSDDLMDSLEEDLSTEESRCPVFLPTLIPPKRWDGMRFGGYYNPFVRTPTLIRFHADSEKVRSSAIMEYDSLAMPRVYSALNYIQEVPWMVNRKVLAVAMKVWDLDLGIANISRRDPIPLPVKPAGLDRPDLHGEARRAEEQLWAAEHPKEFKAWKQEAARVYGENARRLSKANAVRDTLSIAEKFISREFYFPHMLDFRGRMYPIPVYLQPQGNDLARGLLTFAKGKEVGEEGAGWLAIHLANKFGVDKVSNDERIAWVEEREEMWRSIAEGPLRDRRWITETDDKNHWQALAAIFEWVRFLDEGHTMVSSLPIHVDGTCNGIQHLSAMMRDEAGARAVNMMPMERPADIYADVADALQMRLEGIEEAGGYPGQMAALWLETFQRKIPRSFTKNPVMVLPYGGTRDSYFGSVIKWVRKHAPQSVLGLMEQDPEKRIQYYTKIVPWIVTHMWDIVESIVTAGKVCMDWLKKVAGIVADTGQPIVWRTPTGFFVRHFYGRVRERKVETLIDGKRMAFKLQERTEKLSKKEQLQGISPNFVHSMDGSANMETIIRMGLDNDQPPITTIHDAFGTTAGSMWNLFARLRQAFIWVHERDVLTDFRNKAVGMYRDHLLATREGFDWYKAMELAEDTIPHVPKRGNLDVSQVAHSDYFFA